MAQPEAIYITASPAGRSPAGIAYTFNKTG
jgi:hypothetical protein